jgi:hypothetical protein
MGLEITLEALLYEDHYQFFSGIYLKPLDDAFEKMQDSIIKLAYLIV